MLEPESFLNRVGRLFKRASRSNGNSAHAAEEGADIDHTGAVTVETHPLTLRPWRKNSAAIAQLQDGFTSLSGLMNEIRQSMASQGRRQDEQLAYLSALPKLLEAIPESNRLHGETLKAIQEQLQRHGEQDQMLGEILERLSDSGGEQKDLLEGLRERVETLNHQDKAMADSLSSVSVALVSAGKHSAAGTQVLESLRENLKSRDGDLERVLQKQNTRFMTLLIVAICVSVAALTAVGVMGYWMMHTAIK